MKNKRFKPFLWIMLAFVLFMTGCAGSTKKEENLQKIDENTESQTLERFENATLGVIDGSLYAGYSKELFPNAKIDSYQSFTDLFQCVKQGKIDGFMIDMPGFNSVHRTEPGLSFINVPQYKVEIGYGFSKNEKGERIQRQMNAYLDELRADGRLDEIWDYWCGEFEPEQTLEVPEFAEDAKPLSICLDVSRKPFVYLLNNEYVGFEIEIMYGFCETYGYRPEFESALWTAGIAGLSTGKYDVVSAGIYMTDERKESIHFCEPYKAADVIIH